MPYKMLRAVIAVGLAGLASPANAQHVYVRNAETALALRPAPADAPWTALDGQLGGGVDACTDNAGHTFVVTRGLDDAVWLKRQVDGAWHSWERLGGRFTDDPSVACAADAVGIFARSAADGSVHYKLYDPANPLAPYTSLGAEIKGGPDATSSAPGRFEIAVRGMNDAIWFNRVSAGRPEGWRELGGRFTSDPSIIAVERTGQIYLEVFGRGTDNALWHGGVEPEGPTSWVSRGGRLGGSPDAMSSGPQRMEIAARGPGGDVTMITYRGGWSAWQSLGGSTTADIAVAGGRTERPVDTLPTRANASGRFRVWIGGFRVERETYDDMLERDGARDEVFQAPVVFKVDSGGTAAADPETLVSLTSVMGQRLSDAVTQAGSATATGGLWAGDNFPMEPWADTLPGAASMLFEGVIRQGEDGVVIIPSLWEWDANDQNSFRYTSAVWNRRHEIARSVAPIIQNPRVTRERSTFVFAGHNVGVNQPFRWDGSPGNRPIGVRRSGPNQVSFTPQVLVLTYEAADLISRNTFDDALIIGGRVFGSSRGAFPVNIIQRPGVFTIEYQEPDEFQGHYVIYIHVQRCPSLTFCG